jgi:nicotinamide-nucleotide amidase
VKVELISVGTELLLGEVINGNAAWLGQQLTEVGIDATRSVSVGDDLDEIVEAVTDGTRRADAVVLTGGLGPTNDDLTREALARTAGVRLRRDNRIEEELRARFAALGRTVGEGSLRQADVPQGSSILKNPLGSAPGLRVPLPGGVAYALPGVPREMQAMFLASVRPDLLAIGGRPAGVATRTLRTAAVGESLVAERLHELERDTAESDLTIAYLVAPGQVRVRLTAKASVQSAAEKLLAGAEQWARRLLGDTVFGVDSDELDVVVHHLLAEHGATVAVAESLTGGLLGAALTAMPGSSKTFRGGVTAYATPLKAALLDVSEDLLATRGAVDPDVAVAMATGVRDRLRATYGLGVTGVAGPETQDSHPIGTVHIAVAGPGRQRVVTVRLPGDRAHVRESAVVHALDLLRRHALGREPFREFDD